METTTEDDEQFEPKGLSFGQIVLCLALSVGLLIIVIRCFKWLTSPQTPVTSKVAVGVLTVAEIASKLKV